MPERKSDMSIEIIDNSAKVKSQMGKNIEKTLVEMGLHWQRRATELATENDVVDTGRYRASLSFITPNFKSGRNQFAPDVKGKSPITDKLHGKAPDNTVIVGSNVEYAPYLEAGTSKMKARPVVGNAILYYKEEYEEIAAKNLGEGFEVVTNI